MKKENKTKEQLIDNLTWCNLHLETKIHFEGGCGQSLIIKFCQYDEYEIQILDTNFKTIYNHYITREELKNIADNINILLDTTESKREEKCRCTSKKTCNVHKQEGYYQDPKKTTHLKSNLKQ